MTQGETCCTATAYTVCREPATELLSIESTRCIHSLILCKHPSERSALRSVTLVMSQNHTIEAAEANSPHPFHGKIIIPCWPCCGLSCRTIDRRVYRL